MHDGRSKIAAVPGLAVHTCDARKLQPLAQLVTRIGAVADSVQEIHLILRPRSLAFKCLNRKKGQLLGLIGFESSH